MTFFLRQACESSQCTFSQCRLKKKQDNLAGDTLKCEEKREKKQANRDCDELHVTKPSTAQECDLSQMRVHQPSANNGATQDRTHGTP